MAVARALINKPAIVFADEPTGSLDEQNGQKIIQLLFQLNQELGSTLILVTHDMALASRRTVAAQALATAETELRQTDHNNFDQYITI